MTIKSVEWLPSLFAADPLNLSAGMDKIVNSNLNSVHLDIMDGHFVRNFSLGLNVVSAVKERYPNVFRDVHLMLQHPEDFIQKFIQAGAQRIFIHCEVPRKSLEESIDLLKESGIEWGIAINPETPLLILQSYSYHVPIMDMHRVLLMSVCPGLSGQPFIKDTVNRVRGLHKYFPQLEICVDGGINETIAQSLTKLGAFHFVVGSSFFNDK